MTNEEIIEALKPLAEITTFEDIQRGCFSSDAKWKQELEENPQYYSD